MVEANNTYNSGGLNTTGREPFETPFGDNAGPNTGAGTGIGAGTGASHPTTGQYGEVGGVGNVGVTGHGHHSHHQQHHERQEHSLHHSTGGVQSGGLQAGGFQSSGIQSVGAQSGGHKSGLNTGGHSSGHHDHTHQHTADCGHDRTGQLDQNIGNYERTGASGPTTTGAAGTDRFDSDRSSGVGAAGTNKFHGNESHADQNFTGDRNIIGERKDGAVSDAAAVQPGAGQSSVGTSDQEFLDPSRRAKMGAYTDDKAHTKTALTGREGTGNVNTGPNTTDHATGTTTHSTDNTTEKPSLIQKVKNALS